MEHENNPMCQVPLSYLMMLQERGGGGAEHAITWRPQDLDLERAASKSVANAIAERDRAIEERDAFANAIAEFEFRAGCKLEHIPVEALGRAQDAYVSQQAIDTLKSENSRLEKDYNRAVSEMTDWRGRFKELQREKGGGMVEQVEAKAAPYGFTKAGVPRKKPGPPKRRKRAA